MPQLDSLLRIVDAQGGDELRLGSDKSPALYGGGTPKRLTVPATSTSTLLELFGELLDAPRRGALERVGHVDISHESGALGSWTITVTKRPTEELAFDAIVRKKAAPPPKPPAPVASEAPVATAPRAHADLTPAAAPTAPTASPGIEHASARETLPGPLAALASRAVALGASDLHLAVGEPPMFRVDGRLVRATEAPLDGLGAALQQMLSESSRARLARDSSCDLGLDVEGGGRARMNVYTSARGMAAAVRFLPRRPRPLEALGYPLPIEDLALLPNGLVLTTGVTGSGKSTTLAALAEVALARRSIVMVTLEDPIEHVFTATASSLVRQRQIGRDVRDFQTGLRDALREDPDVILIGEMRDPESVALALTAAETGHLVLASLHTRSASSAIDRILDTCAGERQAQVRLQLADCLRAVLAQRLLPREDGGRVLAAEILRNNTPVASAIREGKTAAIRSAMQAGRGAGMLPLERALADLVRARVISAATARGAANDPELYAQYAGER